MTRGVTVMREVMLVPPAVAVMLTGVAAVTEPAGAENMPPDDPPGIVIAAGGWITFGSELVSVTTSPKDGAGLVRVIVPFTLPRGCTPSGPRTKELSAACGWAG